MFRINDVDFHWGFSDLGIEPINILYNQNNLLLPLSFQLKLKMF